MLLKTKSIFKNHKWAIFLAVLTALMVVYPQIYLRYDLGNLYHGIELIGATGDEAAWMSRVREVQDGHPFLSSVYFKEGKGDPYLFQPLGTIIVAYLGKLFSFGINNTFLLSRLLFSFIVFLIIYAFIFLLSKKKLTALTAAAVLLLGRDIISRGGIADLINAGTPSIKYLSLMRPVNPLMTYFFFFGFLLFFWLFFDTSTQLSARKKQCRYGILSALFLGLSFYDYFYTWTFLYSFLGISILIFLFQKKWPGLKRILIVLFGATLIAIPWFINFYRVLTHSNYQEVGQRIGLMAGRTPTLGLMAPIIFLATLILFPRKDKNRYFFALALAATPLIVLNQQFITGKVLSSAHYHWYFTFPLFFIFFFIMFFFLISKEKWKFLRKSLAALAIFSSIGTGLLVQKTSYTANEAAIIRSQRYGPLMDWLNQNTQKDEVVFINEAGAYLIVIYTHLNVLYHTSAKYSLSATTDRLTNTFFLYYRLNGISQDEIQPLLFKEREDISAKIYGMYYQYTAGDHRNIPDELILSLIQKYKESFNVSTGDFFKEMLQKYEVKYVVWDKETDPLWQLGQYQFLEKVTETDNFIIYRFD